MSMIDLNAVVTPRPTLKLYWSSRSPYVRKVMVAAHEVGLAGAIEPVRVVVAMIKLSDEVMAHNPLNKIPTLVLSDGTALFDSPVICEYLDSIAEQPRLFPSGKKRWPTLQMQALGDGMMDLVTQRLGELVRPADLRSTEHLAAWKKKLFVAYDFAEQQIAADVEDSALPHIGHIALGCALAHIDFRFPEDAWRDGRPALTSWYEGHAARASMKATAYENVY
jgi:glutathione S-transferase